MVYGAVPLWFGLATIAREVLVSVMVLSLAGLGAARIDVLWVGKAGTFGLMFAYPTFLLAYGDATLAGADQGDRLGHRHRGPRAGVVGRGELHRSRQEGLAGRPGGAAESGRAEPRMKAVIMAGGEGTRLRPQTSNLPKPMLPLVGRPMMEHIVSLLRRHGITDIVVTVAFLPNAIRSYFGDGSELGVRMVYATEESPLGTAGSVRNAREQLTERFLVISGDVLTDIDLSSVIAFHEKNRATATLALCAVENPLEFGIVITREDGSIERFLEKPGWGQVFSDTINTGIYVLEPEIFDRIPEGRAVDFSSEVFPAVLDAGEPLFGYVADGYWEDVGTTAAYLKAHEDILDGRVQVDVAGFELRPGIWVGKGSSIDPSVDIVGPAFIGENCTIDRDVHPRGVRHGGGQHAAGRTRRGPALRDRRELLPGARGAGRGGGAGPLVRRADGGEDRARCRGRGGVPDRCARRDPGGRQGLPVQGRRHGGPGQCLNRVGVRVGRAPSSDPKASRESPTSTSALSWRCGWPRHGRRASTRARSSRRRGTPAGWRGSSNEP